MFDRDVQQLHDMADNDAKEAYNIRLFLQSLHDATYQHRTEYVDSYQSIRREERTMISF